LLTLMPMLADASSSSSAPKTRRSLTRIAETSVLGLEATGTKNKTKKRTRAPAASASSPTRCLPDHSAGTANITAGFMSKQPRPRFRRTLNQILKAKALTEKEENEHFLDDLDDGRRRKVSKLTHDSDDESVESGQIVSDVGSVEDMEISDGESHAGPSTRPTTDTSPETSPVPPSPKLEVLPTISKAKLTEDKDVDEGVEVDIDDVEQHRASRSNVTGEDNEEEDEDEEDSDYEDEDEDSVQYSADSDENPEFDDDEDNHDYLRLMPRPILERILQRLLKPPQDPKTRRAVQSLITEHLPDTVTAYDTSVRIKINETYTSMVQEMQDEHSSLTSDDFAHVMARFLRNEVRVLHTFPGSTSVTFDLILYIAEHSFGDLELDDRPGFEGERGGFDEAADRALLYVAEQRLEEEGAAFRAAVPGYLETIRAQSMYLYRHGRHPKSWFPATIAFLQASLQPNSVKRCGRLRSDTRCVGSFSTLLNEPLIYFFLAQNENSNALPAQ
jgi:hypothetical protein